MTSVKYKRENGKLHFFSESTQLFSDIKVYKYLASMPALSTGEQVPEATDLTNKITKEEVIALLSAGFVCSVDYSNPVAVLKVRTDTIDNLPEVVEVNHSTRVVVSYIPLGGYRGSSLEEGPLHLSDLYPLDVNTNSSWEKFHKHSTVLIDRHTGEVLIKEKSDTSFIGDFSKIPMKSPVHELVQSRYETCEDKSALVQMHKFLPSELDPLSIYSCKSHNNGSIAKFIEGLDIETIESGKVVRKEGFSYRLNGNGEIVYMSQGVNIGENGEMISLNPLGLNLEPISQYKAAPELIDLTFMSWEGTEGELVKEVIAGSDEGGAFKTEFGYAMAIPVRGNSTYLLTFNKDFSEYQEPIKLARLRKDESSNFFVSALENASSNENKLKVRQSSSYYKENIEKIGDIVTEDWKFLNIFDEEFCRVVFVACSIADSRSSDFFIAQSEVDNVVTAARGYKDGHIFDTSKCGRLLAELDSDGKVSVKEGSDFASVEEFYNALLKEDFLVVWGSSILADVKTVSKLILENKEDYDPSWKTLLVK